MLEELKIIEDTENFDRFSVLEIIKILLKAMLNDKEINGRPIKSAIVKTDRIELFDINIVPEHLNKEDSNINLSTSAERMEEHVVSTLFESNKIITSFTEIKEFITNFPRYKITQNEFEKSITLIHSKYKTLDKASVNKFFKSNDEIAILNKENLFFDCQAAKIDKREHSEKMIMSRVDSIDDYLIANLLSEKKTKGIIYKDLSEIAIYDNGLKYKKSDYKKLPKEGIKFDSFGLRSREISSSDGGIKQITIPTHPVKLNEDLENILLNKTSGIVLLDSLLQQDIWANENFINKLGDNILLNIVTTIEHTQTISPQIHFSTFREENDYSNIIPGSIFVSDFANKLDLKEILRISTENLVLLNTRLSEEDSIKDMLTSIEDYDLRKRFISKILYIGNVKFGLRFKRHSRQFLQQANYHYFKDISKNPKTPMLFIKKIQKDKDKYKNATFTLYDGKITNNVDGEIFNLKEGIYDSDIFKLILMEHKTQLSTIEDELKSKPLEILIDGYKLTIKLDDNSLITEFKGV